MPPPYTNSVTAPTQPEVNTGMQQPAALMGSTKVAIYTCDRLGYITYYNPAAAMLWGREPETGKDLWCGSWKIFKPDGTPLLLDDCPMALTLKEGRAIDGAEILIQRPDGSVRNVIAYPVPMFDTLGNITGAGNTLIDVTDYTQDETRRAMLAAIIESSEDAIISKTLEGIITSWNHAAQHLYGYTQDEIIGRHITTLIPADRLNEEELIIGSIKNNKKVDHFETKRLTKDGREIPISLTVSPIRNSQGHIIGASKIARDISKQKESEAQLQRYAESLEMLISTGRTISENLDVQDILQKVTDATTQLIGAKFGAFFYNKVNPDGESYRLYTLSGAPREAFEQFGMPRNTMLFHPTFNGERIVRVDDITQNAAYGKNAPHNGMPKGHLPVVSYMAVPVISKNGKVIGALFYGHPEAARFTLEHENLVSGVAAQAAVALDNAKLYEEITALNNKKDEFIGLASHELKTPITSISGYLQLIDRHLAEGDRLKTLVAKTLQQVNRLTTLISDLLDVSKIQTGKLPFSYSGFNLNQVITDVIEMMQQTHPSHVIDYHAPKEVINITADQQRIEQVLINLVSNAIKYSPGVKNIIISAYSSNGKAVVSVQDFGIGIDKEQHDRIFSRFYRVENLAAHMSGLGIGLYVSNEIVKRHNGRLWLDSEPGKGSTFYFEIPVVGLG